MAKEQDSWQSRAWRWLSLFAYRQWKRHAPGGRMPVGVPFNRDPDNVCRVYEPRKPGNGDWYECQGDGHYLCEECCHLEVLGTAASEVPALAASRAE